MSIGEIVAHDLFHTARVSHNKNCLLRKLYNKSTCCRYKVAMLYCLADECIQFTNFEKQIERVGLDTSAFQKGIHKMAQADDLLIGTLKKLLRLHQWRVCFG